MPHSPGTSAVCPLSACTTPHGGPRPGLRPPLASSKPALCLALGAHSRVSGLCEPIHPPSPPATGSCVTPGRLRPVRPHLQDSLCFVVPVPGTAAAGQQAHSRVWPSANANPFAGIAARGGRAGGRGGERGTLRVGHAIKAFPTWSVSWTGCQRGGSGCVQIPDPPPLPLHPSAAQAAPPPAHGLPAARLQDSSRPRQLGRAQGQARGRGQRWEVAFLPRGPQTDPAPRGHPGRPPPRLGPGRRPRLQHAAPSGPLWGRPRSACTVSCLCQDEVVCPCAPSCPGPWGTGNSLSQLPKAAL